MLPSGQGTAPGPPETPAWTISMQPSGPGVVQWGQSKCRRLIPLSLCRSNVDCPGPSTVYSLGKTDAGDHGVESCPDGVRITPGSRGSQQPGHLVPLRLDGEIPRSEPLAIPQGPSCQGAAAERRDHCCACLRPAQGATPIIPGLNHRDPEAPGGHPCSGSQRPCSSQRLIVTRRLTTLVAQAVTGKKSPPDRESG